MPKKRNNGGYWQEYSASNGEYGYGTDNPNYKPTKKKKENNGTKISVITSETNVSGNQKKNVIEKIKSINKSKKLSNDELIENFNAVSPDIQDLISLAFDHTIIDDGKGSFSRYMGVELSKRDVANSGIGSAYSKGGVFAHEFGHAVDCFYGEKDSFLHNYASCVVDINGKGTLLEIYKKEITSNNIIRYVRGMTSSRGGEFKTLYRLVENQVEALEFFIPEATSFTSIPLKDLNVNPKSLIACIIRNGEVIIPGGKDTIEPLDNIVIITTDPYIKDVSGALE